MGKLRVTAVLEIVFNSSCITRQLPRHIGPTSIVKMWFGIRKNGLKVFCGASKLQPVGLPPTDNFF